MVEAIRIRTNASGDEWISPGSIFVVRAPDEYIRHEFPQYKSYVKSSNYEGHSIDDVDTNIPSALGDKFIRLSAPSGLDVWVNSTAVTDRDPPNSALDHAKAKSVLRFGATADAPKQAVRQTEQELVNLWRDKGWPTAQIESANTPSPA